MSKSIDLNHKDFPIEKISQMLEHVIKEGLPQKIDHKTQRKHLIIGLAIDKAVDGNGGILELSDEHWGKVIELWKSAELPPLVELERRIWAHLDGIICQDENNAEQS